MRNILMFFILILLVGSCQEKALSLNIDSNKVNQITIQNKVYCNYKNFNKKRIVVTDKNDIQRIVKAFKSSEFLKEKVSTNSNNGFFEIDFNEGELNHYYTINYTVYDGVVVRNDNNGKQYRNNRLEVLIGKLFLEKF